MFSFIVSVRPSSPASGYEVTTISCAVLGSCCAIGIVAIGFRRLWRVPLGTSVQDMLDIYNSDAWRGIHNIILNERVDSYEKTERTVNTLKTLMTLEVVMLGAGILSLIFAITGE